MAKVTRLTLDNNGGLERRRLHLREISDDMDAPLDTVGQDLRKARQLKGEDLAQISRILKIRKDHLDALEESNFDALPGRAYTIGFARSYAAYVGLDPNACVTRLKTEIAGRGEAKEGPVPISAPRDRKLPQGTVIFVVILIIALIYGIYYLIVAVNRLASEPVPPVPPQLAAQAGLSLPPSAPPPAATQAVTQISQTSPAPDTSTSPATADTAAAPAAPAATIAPPAAAQQPATAAQPVPEGRVYGAQNKSRITLRAHKPARVTVLGPNSQLYLDRLLQPGDSYLVPDTTGLTLSTSDAGAVEMILDGASIGYAGGEGAASTALSLNPQELSTKRSRG
jgi:cytoskeleton protein RodZ